MKSLDSADIFAHFLHFSRNRGIPGCIGEDKQIAFRGETVSSEGFHRTLGVIRPAVNEKGDRSRSCVSLPTRKFGFQRHTITKRIKAVGTILFRHWLSAITMRTGTLRTENQR